MGNVQPNPAIQNNRCYSFIARDVRLTREQSQDEKEDIEVVLKPLSEIPAAIRNGEITHALVLAAFYRFYMEYQPDISISAEGAEMNKQDGRGKEETAEGISWADWIRSW